MQGYDADHLTPRVSNLLESLPSRTNGSFYTRRIFWTESYRHTEGQPQVIRQAKAFAHLLGNIPIIVYSDELIVAHIPKVSPPIMRVNYSKEAVNIGMAKPLAIGCRLC